MPLATDHLVSNRILRALDPATLEGFRPSLELVELAPRDLMFDYDQPVEHVFFPENIVASVVGVMADGSAVETATIGYEGVVGLVLFFGSDRIAAQAFCQVPGHALRMPAQVFRDALDSPDLRAILGRYTQALLTQIAQSSACNRLHPMSQRCARWLLQSHDRVQRDHFSLTQDFLAQMLGVRRATVNEAAGALQDAGAISYKYGKISVIDRARLEQRACECYGIIAREYARLIDGKELPQPLRDVPMSEGGQSTLKPPA
jgi:CRP-like cAMP-binding protein